MEGTVARLAGLPLSAISDLRGTRSATIVDDLIRVADDVAVEGRQLADELHAVIGGLADDHRRPRVIGLRRALHRGRRPKRHEWSPDIAACMTTDLAARITHWTSRLESSAHCPPELAEALADDVRQERDLLVKVATEPLFREAIRTSSYALDEAIGRWAASPSNPPRDQTVETLARYVARATVKTSPHSTFLASGPVRIDDETPTVRHVPHDRAVSMELGVAWSREAIAAAVTTVDGVRSRLIVRPNPSSVIAANRVDFVGSPPDESLRSLPLNDAVRRCLDLAGSTPFLTYGDLVAQLAHDLGPADEVATFVDYLVSVEVLCLVPFVELPVDIAGAAADWLDDVRPKPALVAHLRAVSEATSTAVSTSDITQVNDRRVAIAAGLCGILTAAEPQDFPISADYVRPERTRDTGVTVGPGLAVGRPWLESLAPDLDAIRRWCAPFSTSLPLRLALTELLNTEFGGAPDTQSMPLLHLHQRMVQRCAVDDAIGGDLRTLARGWPQGDLPTSAFASLRSLADIRAQARDIFDRRDDTDRQVVLDSDTLVQTAANYPSWVPEFPGMGVDLQPIPVADPATQPSAVINTLNAPYHRNRRRVDWLSTVFTAESHPRKADDGTGPMVADLAGSFGLPLNDHAPGVPFEIDYPFTFSRVPRAERIAVSDLTVGIGADGLAALFSARHGRQVQPAYLGVMALRFLPPLARLIVGAFAPIPYPSMAVILSLTAMRRSAIAACLQDAVPYRSSRLVVGGVVVRRRAVVVNSDQIPTPRSGDSDAETLLRFRRWQRDIGVPDRCFVRLPGDEQTVGTLSRAWHKPFYLDVTSWSLFRGFSRAIPRSTSRLVVFEEALPDPLTPNGLEFATELSVEVTKP